MANYKIISQSSVSVLSILGFAPDPIPFQHFPDTAGESPLVEGVHCPWLKRSSFTVQLALERRNP
jgi:hypothetical protein